MTLQSVLLAYTGCLYSLNMGRAPVRAVFEEALQVLAENKEKLADVISHRLPLTEAAEGYRLFDTQVARKVVLRP